MRRFRTLLGVLVATVVLVTCTDYAAFAATGKSLLLGKVNKADRQTSLVRTTSGPALQLSTRSTASAPMVVNGRGRVTNLNADAIDGLDSSALRTVGHVFTHGVGAATDNVDLTVPLQPGSYHVSYSAHLYGAQTGHVECFFVRDAAGTHTFFGDSGFNAGAGTPGLSGSGGVSLPAGTTLRLRCLASNPFTTSPDEPLQVTATRLDSMTSGALVPTSSTPAE